MSHFLCAFQLPRDIQGPDLLPVAFFFFFFVPLPCVDKGLSTFYLERIGEILCTVLAGAP